MTNPLTRPPAWLRPLFPGCEWRGAATGPGGRPRLYLTFDDGPIPEETPWVLAQLAVYQAKATFFCVGDNLLRHPDIARAALAAGHRLANHTQHHQSAWATPRPSYLAGVAACEEVLAGARRTPPSRVAGAVPSIALPVDFQVDERNGSGAGAAPRLFRPPYGRLTWPILRALRRQHYRVIMWTLLTRDYDPDLAPEKALRLTLAATRPGDIIVLHDSHKASRSLRYLLPRLLAHYAALGYEFAVL